VGDRILLPGEWAVLALLCERPAHGWSLANQLAPSGELGSIWSLRRQVVYRSLEILRQCELIELAGREPGIRGPSRTLFKANATGEAKVRRWLQEPVEHVGDAGRSLLLLKLAFADRFGIDPQPMLVAERESYTAVLDSLEDRATASSGNERVLLRFQVESTQAVLRFVESLLSERVPSG